MISYELDLNLIPGGVAPRLDVSQYDHGQTITCVLWEGNTPFTLPNASAASVSGTKPDGTGFTYNCTYEYGQPVVTITEQMTAVAGEVVCELVIVKEGERQGTVNFILDVEKAALDQDTPLSETDIPIIEQIPEIQAEVEAAKQLAEMWAVGPDGSEEEQPSSTNNAYYWAMQAASYAGGGLKPEVVQALPTQNISTSTLYFVPSSDPSTSNFYDEYINVDGTSQGWEKIGTTSTDLTAYQKSTDNNLNTTSKTIVGAINELDSDIDTINTNLADKPTRYTFTMHSNTEYAFPLEAKPYIYGSASSIAADLTLGIGIGYGQGSERNFIQTFKTSTNLTVTANATSLAIRFANTSDHDITCYVIQ